MNSSNFNKLVRDSTNYAGNALRDGEITQKYKKYIKSVNGRAPIPSHLAFNPITKRIVKASSVYDLRHKTRTYKKRIKEYIDQNVTQKRTIKTLDALNHFFLIRHNISNVNTIEDLYKWIRKALDEQSQEGFIRVHFRKHSNNKTFFRNIANEYLDTFDEFKNRIEEVQEGDAIGSENVSEDEFTIITNIFDIFLTKLGGDGASDFIIWKKKNTEVKNSSCWAEILKFIDPSLKKYETLKDKEIPLCEKCLENKLPDNMCKCKISFSNIESKPYWACPNCKFKTNEGKLIPKIIKNCSDNDAIRFKYLNPKIRYWDNFILILEQLSGETGKKIRIIANSFTLTTDIGTREIRKEKPIKFNVPNGKKAPKLIKANMLTLKEGMGIKPVVLWENEKFDEEDDEAEIVTIIYDEIQSHYDIAEGDLQFDNIALSRNNTVYRITEKGQRALYRFNQLNKMNKTNKKVNSLKIFWDLETIIDVNARNIMKEYSISFVVLSDEDLKKLSDLDTIDYDDDLRDDKIKKLLFGKIFNYVGFDCIIKFVKWIFENQYIENKKEKKEIFNRFDLISFNGSSFDHFLLLNALLDIENDFGQEINVSEIFYNGSQILNMRLNNKHTVFDLAKHLTGSLKYNCEGFKVNTLGKGSFDHHKAQKLHDEGKLIEFMTGNKELEDYNNRDVLSLAVIYQRYVDALKEMEQTKKYADKLCSIKTIGSLVYKIANDNWKNLLIEQDEIINNKKSIRRIKRINFPKLNKNLYDDMLKYKSAGRVELFNGIQKIKEQVCSKDICSMYPFAMAVLKEAYYPCGELYETEKEVDNKMGFYYCDIDQSILRKKNLPNIIAEKIYKKKKDGSEGSLEGNNWNSENILYNYFISDVLIKQLRKYGCKVTVKNGIYFSDKIRGCDLFEFILEFMQKKNEQDILRKKDENFYNAALRETLKLLMNSMSGKVIENLHLEKTVITDTFGYLKIKESDKTESITTINIIGSKIFTTYKVTEDSMLNKQKPIYLGCLIYAYSQIHIYNTLYAVIGKKDMIYTDTDAGKMRKTVFNRIDVIEYYKTTKIEAWDKAILYDERLRDHLIYDTNSKVFGSYEEELKDNDISYFLQKKGYLILNKTKLLKMGFKGVPKNSIVLNGNESFLKERIHDNVIKYDITNQKEAIDYSNENKLLQIQYNAEEFAEELFNKKFIYVLTTSFRKIVKNTLSNVGLKDTEKFQQMNNTIRVTAVVKRLTLNV